MPDSATIRSVRVRLDADVAGYIRDMTLAGKATEQAFGSSRLHTMDTDLRSMSRSSDQAGTSLSRLGTDLRAVDQQATRTSTSLRRNSADLDRYSGRLGIMVSAIAALGPAAIPITASTIPAILGLTSGVGALVAALGTGVLAIHGVGDALKALDAYQLNPTEDNLQKLRQAMDALPASGRELVRTLDRLEPSLQRLQRAAAQGFLPDADKGLRELMVLFPQVRRFIGGMSDELGRLSMEGSHSLVHDPAWRAFFAMVRSEGVPVMDAWAHATGNVAKGLASLLVDFSGEIGRFDSGLVASSRRFADWAAGLNQTQGFKDFLDYIHQEGPQVREFLSSLVDALLAVLHAMAPWGSAVLPILTDVLHLLTAIADSKAGPVLFDMAAGMLLFTRAAKGLSGLGITSLTTSWSAGFKELAAQIKVTTASLETLGPAAASAQVFSRTRAGYANTAGLALRSGAAKNLLGIGGTLLLGAGLAGKPGAKSTLETIGGGATLGAAIGLPEAGPSLGLSVAIGAAAGGAVALGKALLSSDQATKQQLADWSTLASTIDSDTGKITASTRQQVAATLRSSGAVATAQQNGIAAGQVGAAVLGSPQAYTQVINQIKDKIATLQSYTKGSGGLFDSSGIQQNITDLQTLEKNLEAGRAAIANTTKAWRQDQAVLAGATRSLSEYDAALQRHTAAANSAFGAETAWRQALKAAQAQAKTNAAGINGSTNAALNNRDALSQLAAAWNNQSAAVRNNVDRFHQARAAFIETAQAMGVPEAEAKRLAARLLAIPKQVVTKMYADAGQALGTIAQLKASLAGLHDKTIVTRMITERATKGAAGVVPKAEGGTVPGQLYPYGDKTLILAAPGEELITNRHGEADRFRADRAAGRIPAYADGGTVRGGGGYGRVLRDSDHGTIGNLTKALDDLTNKQLRHLGVAIDDLSKHRLQRLNTAISKVDSLASSAYDTAKSRRSAYRGTISQGLMPDLFASDANSGSVFSRGNVATIATPPQVNATLRKTRANAQEFTRLVKILRSRGLSGGALAQIIGDGDIDKARMYAALPASSLHTYSRLYTSTQHAVAQAAAAGGNALVPNVGQLHADLLAVKDAVHEVQHAISANETKAHQSRQQAAQTAHHHTMQAVDAKAAKGARDRR